MFGSTSTMLGRIRQLSSMGVFACRAKARGGSGVAGRAPRLCASAEAARSAEPVAVGELTKRPAPALMTSHLALGRDLGCQATLARAGARAEVGAFGGSAPGHFCLEVDRGSPGSCPNTGNMVARKFAAKSTPKALDMVENWCHARELDRGSLSFRDQSPPGTLRIGCLACVAPIVPRV